MSKPQAPLILFDGYCNLCNGWVKFVIRHDKNSVFRFAPLSSPFAQKLIGTQQNLIRTDSVIYVKGDQFYSQSDAALKILYDLGWPWKVTSIFNILPAFMRDLMYDALAKWRYRLFGKKEVCMIPGKEIAQRFVIDDEPLNQ